MNSRIRSLALGTGLLMMAAMENNRAVFDADINSTAKTSFKHKSTLTPTQAKKRKANKQAKKSRKANRK